MSDLFSTIGQIIVDAKGSADITDTLARLSAAVEANQDRQFGRDVRELFLVACRELAPRCEAENGQTLASVITRLLPRDPVDRSVLPFLLPHFDRLIDLRMGSEDMTWDLVRDIHWAKTGSRLGEDLPEEPIMMFYLKPDAGYLIQVDPNGTPISHRLKAGFSNLEALSKAPTILRLLSKAEQSRHYWSDQGLIPPLVPNNYPFKVAPKTLVN